MTGTAKREQRTVIFNAGDQVRITFRGKTVTGEVLMVSANRLSLTLMFDGNLSGYSNLMPVLWVEDKFVDLLTAEAVTISPLHQK